MDAFRSELLAGRWEYARELAPPAFAEAIDKTVALSLFAAAVALLVRLAEDRAAACLAEEIIAVSLIADAETQLDVRGLSAEQTAHAHHALQGVFDLFQDDDVLALFEMSEPADAAVARHDPINRKLGVVDQRLEAWFRPFGGVLPTGYLNRDRPAG